MEITSKRENCVRVPLLHLSYHPHADTDKEPTTVNPPLFHPTPILVETCKAWKCESEWYTISTGVNSLVRGKANAGITFNCYTDLEGNSVFRFLVRCFLIATLNAMLRLFCGSYRTPPPPITLLQLHPQTLFLKCLVSTIVCLIGIKGVQKWLRNVMATRSRSTHHEERLAHVAIAIVVTAVADNVRINPRDIPTRWISGPIRHTKINNYRIYSLHYI